MFTPDNKQYSFKSNKCKFIKFKLIKFKCKKIFLNKLPSRFNELECGIVSLDIGKNNGTHWVSYYKNKYMFFK